jgi:pyruvate,water dikinase
MGRALVLPNFEVPDMSEIGILVTKRTDPGWTPLMALSKGLVVEHGGMLSHASIVARELGIPTVIGVEGACDRIKNGDMLTVDGDAGNVLKMDEDESE